MGVIVLLSSYRNKSESITRAAKGLIFGTFLCGILGGMIVFQYLGHMSFLTNTPIHSLPLNGPMLSFVAYPTALAMIPFPNFFSLLFFLIMITLGIDTLMAMTESTIGYIQDEFPNQFILIHFFPKTISYFPSFIT
jgi:NSS family neurotransmitter:Na+ symporter